MADQIEALEVRIAVLEAQAARVMDDLEGRELSEMRSELLRQRRIDLERREPRVGLMRDPANMERDRRLREGVAALSDDEVRRAHALEAAPLAGD